MFSKLRGKNFEFRKISRMQFTRGTEVALAVDPSAPDDQWRSRSSFEKAALQWNWLNRPGRFRTTLCPNLTHISHALLNFEHWARLSHGQSLTLNRVRNLYVFIFLLLLNTLTTICCDMHKKLSVFFLKNPPSSLVQNFLLILVVVRLAVSH